MSASVIFSRIELGCVPASTTAPPGREICVA